MLLSAGVYVRTDTSLGLGGSAGLWWLLVWWSLLAFQMVYGKHLTQALDMSESERVFYTNLLSIPPTAALCVAMGEHHALPGLVVTARAARWMLLSCGIGVGISYSGWRLKDLVTATTFTLVGVLNKMATIALSAVVFPGATSAKGVVALFACIVFGLAYQDAPLRSVAVARAPGGLKARDSAYSAPNGPGLPQHVVLGGGGGAGLGLGMGMGSGAAGGGGGVVGGGMVGAEGRRRSEGRE